MKKRKHILVRYWKPSKNRGIFTVLEGVAFMEGLRKAYVRCIASEKKETYSG